MLKVSKKTWLFVIVAVALCFVGSLGASLVQGGMGKVKVSIYNDRTMTQIADVIKANNGSTGRNIDVSFTGSATAKMTYKVLVPKNATAANLAPAIVIMHGGLSNKNTTLPVHLELARRGYVVIAFDAMGHGKTDQAVDGLTHNTMGMEAMVELAMSMPCVDPNQVGVTGHSWGNNGSAAVLNAINLGTENPRINAFLCAQGSLAIFDLQPGAVDGVTFGFDAGKYDEMDVTYFGSYTLGESAIIKGWVQEAYPEFNDAVIPMGVWFDSRGPHNLQEGTKFDGVGGRVVYNPENTHPAALFSLTGVATNINFFYGAFGVPGGASYIGSGNQIWWLYMCFVLIGMAGWFCLGLAIMDLLLHTPLFAGLRGSKDSLVIADRDSLPSFKDPRESVPMIAMFVILLILSYMTLLPAYNAGSKFIPSSNFFPNASHTSSAIGFWSWVVALISIIAIFVVSGVKVLANMGNKDYKWKNPLDVAKLDGSKLAQTAVLSFLVFCAMHVILRIIDAVFKVDFVFATIDITTFRIEKIFVMFRYMLLCAPFYIIHAILNNNTRYRDLPEWASTAIVCLGNTLALAFFLFQEYSTLLATGGLAHPDACSMCTVLWSMLLPMVVAPIIARYAYKRTGNIWAGALLNSFVFIMMQVGTGQYMIEGINITMFGL